MAPRNTISRSAMAELHNLIKIYKQQYTDTREDSKSKLLKRHNTDGQYRPAHNRINKERINHDLPVLTRSVVLDSLASEHAKLLASDYSKVRASNRSLREAYGNKLELENKLVGVNVSVGETIDQMITKTMSSKKSNVKNRFKT